MKVSERSSYSQKKQQEIKIELLTSIPKLYHMLDIREHLNRVMIGHWS